MLQLALGLELLIANARGVLDHSKGVTDPATHEEGGGTADCYH
jgi:hypothetical protein